MKNNKSLPFMSIVVCMFNGRNVIERSIESLLAQNYPVDRFEILIIDDASTDDGFEIASRYPVKVIRHSINQGVASARNTGLEHANGDIYVCFDDDCLVAPNWLQNLATGYEKDGVLGSGSVIAPPSDVSGLVDQFMAATASGSAPSLKQNIRNSFHKRFLAYIFDQLKIRKENQPTRPYPVRVLYGATASFPVEVLKAVNGWNPKLRWMEDTDISTRISQTFPGRNFYTVPSAKIIHDPKMSLKTFIRRPYIRGVANLQFYNHNHVLPPIFPFPILWLFTVLLTAINGPVWLICSALILPQLLYIWWPIRYARERNFWYILFPYLQMAEEMATVVGLIRAFFILRFGKNK